MSQLAGVIMESFGMDDWAAVYYEATWQYCQPYNSLTVWIYAFSGTDQPTGRISLL